MLSSTLFRFPASSPFPYFVQQPLSLSLLAANHFDDAKRELSFHGHGNACEWAYVSFYGFHPSAAFPFFFYTGKQWYQACLVPWISKSRSIVRRCHFKYDVPKMGKARGFVFGLKRLIYGNIEWNIFDQLGRGGWYFPRGLFYDKGNFLLKIVPARNPWLIGELNARAKDLLNFTTYA